METRPDQQTRPESKTRLVEQINNCLRSCEYSRALDLLRDLPAGFRNDAELCELEKLARDGVQRSAEAQRLITESQGLFAQQKPAEAIQLLRQAYELDKNNDLARAILANALVEHARSILETDWLGAETAANQALALNPAHPTAKTILSTIVDQKEASSAEDWVSQARKLQSSGDLMAALAWVAEGLAVHPHEPKLLQIQDEIQRDQDARRRQNRRRDLEDLRRMEVEIDGAAGFAAKQALGERIQMLAARYWTDGEILSVANGLLHRLGLAGASSNASPHGPRAPVILHVPQPVPPKLPADRSANSTSTISPTSVPSAAVPAVAVVSDNVPPGTGTAKTLTSAPEVQSPAARAALPPVAEPSVPAAAATSAPAQPRESASSKSPNLAILILASSLVAVTILFAAVYFFEQKHHAQPVAKTPEAPPEVTRPAVSAPAVSEQANSSPAQTTPKPPAPAAPASSNTDAEKIIPDKEPPATPVHNAGTLLVVAGQDGARVSLDGKLQPQLTQAGQLRIANLELKNYVVEVSKNGFQDPPRQEIRLRKGEQARLAFHLQPLRLQPAPQPHMASLTIQGGAPGTAVFVDQAQSGTIQPDGTLSISTVSPGDHTVELRKAQFKPRQIKEHFVEGETISLSAADAALEAAPGELKIIFAPADARVAVVKGALLTMVSSGVPLTLAAGSYTLTARTVDGFTRSSTVEVVAGQARTLDLPLAPNGMSNWDNPGAWKHGNDGFTCKGGDFVLYGDVPASGLFAFSAMISKGHLLQWVVNYTDPGNFILFQMDDNNFYRTVIRNGQKTDEVKVPQKADKKSFRTLHIRVSPTEVVQQIKNGDSWAALDRFTQPGRNLTEGKFGFYIPGDDQVALASFAHYAELNLH